MTEMIDRIVHYDWGKQIVKGWKKFLLIIFAIVLLLTVFFTYFLIFDFGSVSRYLYQWVNTAEYFYLLTALSGIVTLGAVIMILRAALAPSLKSYLKDSDKDGEMYITKAALESNVRSTANSFSEVRNTMTDVKIIQGQNPKIRTKVNCGVLNAQDLNHLGKEIQGRIKEQLENFTGYPVESVEVKFYDMKKDTNQKVV